MALPKIATPTYDLKLPSNGEKVAYRPFLVKEEKLLLMAMEDGNQSAIASTLKQIIHNCTDGKVDVETLPMFDVEYLFLQLRIKSVEEVSEFTLKCRKCSEEFNSKINLNDVEVKFPEEKQDFKIQLTSDVGIIMKYPTLALMADSALDVQDENTESLFNMISNCVDSIYDEEQVYNDFTKQEVDEFMENLPQEQFKKISKFFENMPKLKHDIKFNCPKCKTKNSITIQGLQDFFDSASLTTT
jgi:DNA-directed RNA polymerase subunit M/transcription elongation factor TFIIS